MKSLVLFLTLSRIPLALLTIYLYQQGNAALSVLAFVLFLIGSFSDTLDGILARKYHVTSKLGAMLDPITDKFFVLSLYWFLYSKQYIILEIFAILLVREVGIFLWRLLLQAQKETVPVETIGKWKTMFQMIALGGYLLSITLFANNLLLQYQVNINLVLQLLLYIATFLTVISGLSLLTKQYIKRS
jgi:CDP-diacylglycerol---glycerol-3-phosphate 3-phosphatidyltransferase